MSKYTKLVYDINEILNYIKENDDYIDHIDEKYKEFSNTYKSLYLLIKNKEFDLSFFLKMIYILHKIEKKEITKNQADIEFGKLLSKKYDINMNLSDEDLKQISINTKIPMNQLKQYYKQYQ